MNLKSLSNETLTEKLRDLSKRDLRLTAEIVSHIHEFMVRRLYFEHGCTSIFAYLTDHLGYPRATAQNRIDAARLLEAVPEIKEELATGKINLGQITLISMGIRQAEKENPGMKVSVDQKRQLIERMVNRGTTEKFESIGNTGQNESGETTEIGGNSVAARSEHASAQIVARELDIKIRSAERVRVHQDGSVTIEVHLSKEEFENLKRVRELNTHKNHNANLGETVAEAAKFYVEKKDPRRLKTKIVLSKSSSNSNSEINLNQAAGSSDSNLKTSSDSNPESSSESNRKFSSGSNLKTKSPATGTVTPKSDAVSRKTGAGSPERTQRSYLSVHIVRAIHQRDKSCRWIDASTGHACGSTYQLQIDHIKGLADGGTDAIENLELKCAMHNRRKFELERLDLAAVHERRLRFVLPKSDKVNVDASELFGGRGFDSF